MVINGFYIIKNEFFDFVQDPFLKDNKDGNRPFYYCLEEEVDNTILYWMIPLSSRVEKYQKIIQTKKSQNKPTDGLYICRLPGDKESTFLIQDMFPLTENYIEREYTLNGNHMVLIKEKDIKNISLKAKTIRELIKRGIKLTPTSPNVPRIITLLLNQNVDSK